ncbi:hypothetical protein ACFO9Q_18655 [Paenibacillus sp. GCM10023252]|uniref:hypothetical protein n=1 Tax=Paenibacillus sp. GCM10023252 TaxID=3252649 RepID=UPI003624444E
MPDENDKYGFIRLQRMERWLISMLWLGGVFFTCLLIAVKLPRYWEYIASEQTPMTWLQSLMWFGCTVLAMLCLMMAYVRDGFHREAAMWLMLSCGFTFLMLDERFAIHERIRDRYLKPTGFRLLPWMEAGDYIVLLYAVAALFCTVLIYRLFRVRRGALLWLGLAALLFACAVGADTLDVSRMTMAEERFEQTLEECVELAAVLSLFSSMLLMLTHYVRDRLASS